MKKSEAVQKTKKQINEEIDDLLVEIIKIKEKIRNARTIPDLMMANKLLMEYIVETLPLESWDNPFCWLLAKERSTNEGDTPWDSYVFPREEKDCELCEYAQTYGNCFQKGSALDKIDKAKWRLLFALRRYWKEDGSDSRDIKAGMPF